MRNAISKTLSMLFVAIIICATTIAIVFANISPSNDREWSADQDVLPDVWINGDTVSILNVRDNDYRSTDDYTVSYYDKTYDLNGLESAWFVMEPFAGSADAAHTMVSFGFENGDYVAISVEVRKEKDESFSPWKGLLKQYEIMYVIADERDVIRLRSNYRHDDVYLYPVRADKSDLRALFLDMVRRAQELKKQPEFYNTIFNNCTNSIVGHVNRIAPGRIPWNKSFVFTGKSDRYAYDIGLIDTDLPFDEARKAFRINDSALRADQDPDFSRAIRKAMPLRDKSE
jgi:hypothetical protein